MTSVPSQPDLLCEFERLLQPSLLRVHRGAMKRQVTRAAERGLELSVLVAAAFVLLRVAGWVMGRPVPWEWTVYVGIVAVGVLAPILWGLARGWSRKPSLAAVAERLDLAAENHNRVANGIALLRSTNASPFGQAAVQDGLTYLRGLKAASPYVEPTHVGWRRDAGLAALFVALTAASAFWVGTRAVGLGVREPVMAETLPTANRKAAGRIDRERENQVALPGRPPASTLARGRTGSAAAARSPLSQRRSDPVTGRTGSGTSAAVSPSSVSASARGDSTGAGATSQSHEQLTRPASSAPRAKPSRENGPRESDGQEASSAVAQGASGGGSVSAIHHLWAERSRTTEGEQEEAENDETVEDESQSSVQRGGIQPSLKDRQEAPSRELGISGEQGPPGSGRGGPTPPKKSRGTASLVLGVPIPDFVKGRPGPGQTKITHERIEPSPMPGEPSIRVDVTGRTLPEGVCPRFDVPPAWAGLVEKYLVALHSSDRSITEQGPPVSSPEVSAQE